MKETITKTTVTEDRVRLQCIRCGKEIIGFNEKQVMYLLKQHYDAKHEGVPAPKLEDE